MVGTEVRLQWFVDYSGLNSDRKRRGKLAKALSTNPLKGLVKETGSRGWQPNRSIVLNRRSSLVFKSLLKSRIYTIISGQQELQGPKSVCLVESRLGSS